MDEYNKTLVEDTSRNRMKESLLLFRMITTKHFADKPVVLLLNKRDLFVEKIQKVDLNVCFPDYTGGCNYDPAAAFIINEFKKVSGPEWDGRTLGTVVGRVLVWSTFACCVVRVHATELLFISYSFFSCRRLQDQSERIFSRTKSVRQTRTT